MLNISDRIFIDIKIDGNDLPTSPNIIGRVTMTEGAAAMSPAIELLLNDYTGHLSRQLALTDGNELLVTIGKTPNDVKTVARQYRVFGIRSITTSQGPAMQIIGIYDAPGYLTGSVRESFKDSTGGVLREIAARCKLTYRGPEDFNGKKTADSQVWLNVAKSRAMFAFQTARHGYIDDTSAMYLALTSLGELRYVNLNDVIETPSEKIKRQFLHNSVETAEESDIVSYVVASATTRSTAGLMNTWHNYGSTRIEHVLSGVNEEHSKIDVQTNGNYLAINDTVKKTVERSRVDYSPIDCGNTHQQFERALYQNLKLIALFSEHVSLLTYEATDLQLLDVVVYRQANADIKTPASNSDIYIVVAKTIMGVGAHYAERFELARRSITEKGATELATSATTVNTDPTIPVSEIDPTSNVAAGTLPRAQSLTSISRPVSSSMATTRTTASELKTGYVNTVTNLKQTLAAAKQVQGSVNNARMLVAQVKASLPSMKRYADIGESMGRQMKYNATSMKNMVTSLRGQNLKTGVRRTMLLEPGGIMDSMTYMQSAVKQQMQVASILSPISYQMNRDISVIESVSGGRQAVQEYNTQRTRIMSNAYVARLAQSDTWNQSVSLIDDKNVPTNFTDNGSKMTRALTDLYRAPNSGSTLAISLAASTNDMTGLMMERNSGHESSWVATNASWEYDASVDVNRTAYEQKNGVYSGDSLWSAANYMGEQALPLSLNTDLPVNQIPYVYSLQAADDALADAVREEGAVNERLSDEGKW